MPRNKGKEGLGWDGDTEPDPVFLTADENNVQESENGFFLTMKVGLVIDHPIKVILQKSRLRDQLGMHPLV
ncbi:MAG: hypothetical protein GX905_09615 [Bacteroidales bacterium]|nr:hypothetical protein [Bacteroidales bacterium]